LDGQVPYGLMQAADGNFYGTTLFGGAWGGGTCGELDGCGTAFQMTPGGNLTTVYSFCSQGGCADGARPTGLIQASDGDFYGTTQYGGGTGTCAESDFAGSGCGTVIRLALGLGLPVPVVNAGGILNSASYTTGGVAPGSIVSIFGTNLAGATAAASAIPLPTALGDVSAVTFNGVPAGLYFVSPNQINAQIPFDVVGNAADGTVNVEVTRGGVTSEPQDVFVGLAAPGIFTTTANGLGQAFAYDNTTGAIAAPAGVRIGNFAAAPISVSSGHALIIACTGLGAVTPGIGDYVAASDGVLQYAILDPLVSIGGVPAKAVYAVLSPQFVSEYQIGVIPDPTTPTGDAVPVQLEVIFMTTTDKVTIAVAP
jgi:uncharacterized protein (TIGR03437 family)